MCATPLHVPVLLQEVLENLPVPPSARILDLTLGLGGHAEALLATGDSGTRYLGVDRDPDARAAARERLGHDSRLTILAGTYEDIWTDPAFRAWIQLEAPEGLDAILMDLGVSTLQLKTAGRGFSFREVGPLDMRMNTEDGLSALEWLEGQDETSLANTIYQYGEERASRPISRAILRALRAGELATTTDLADAIYTVLPKIVKGRRVPLDPATRTFQAIRIAVNGELEGLSKSIETAIQALRPGGRIGVISFHSLEDRIAKQTLRRLSGIYDGPGRHAPSELPKIVRLIHPGGFPPTETEAASNPPSRSARLRVAERLT